MDPLTVTSIVSVILFENFHGFARNQIGRSGCFVGVFSHILHNSQSILDKKRFIRLVTPFIKVRKKNYLNKLFIIQNNLITNKNSLEKIQISRNKSTIHQNNSIIAPQNSQSREQKASEDISLHEILFGIDYFTSLPPNDRLLTMLEDPVFKSQTLNDPIQQDSFQQTVMSHFFYPKPMWSMENSLVFKLVTRCDAYGTITPISQGNVNQIKVSQILKSVTYPTNQRVLSLNSFLSVSNICSLQTPISTHLTDQVRYTLHYPLDPLRLLGLMITTTIDSSSTVLTDDTAPTPSTINSSGRILSTSDTPLESHSKRNNGEDTQTQRRVEPRIDHDNHEAEEDSMQ